MLCNYIVFTAFIVYSCVCGRLTLKLLLSLIKHYAPWPKAIDWNTFLSTYTYHHSISMLLPIIWFDLISATGTVHKQGVYFQRQVRACWAPVTCWFLMPSASLMFGSVSPWACSWFQFLCQRLCHPHQASILLGGRRERFTWWKITTDTHGSCIYVADRVCWNSANKEQHEVKKEVKFFSLRHLLNPWAWCCVPLSWA